MRRVLTFVALSLLAGAALADGKHCIVNWPWQIPDSHERQTQYLHKSLHALGSGGVTLAVAKATDSVDWGIAAGVAAGAVREVYKYRHAGMTCEWSSMTFDAAGVALGAPTAQRWFVVPRQGGAVVAFSTRF